jgi:hypothetical protein
MLVLEHRLKLASGGIDTDQETRLLPVFRGIETNLDPRS